LGARTWATLFTAVCPGPRGGAGIKEPFSKCMANEGMKSFHPYNNLRDSYSHFLDEEREAQSREVSNLPLWDLVYSLYGI
jgi:hypothetical protein